MCDGDGNRSHGGRGRRQNTGGETNMNKRERFDRTWKQPKCLSMEDWIKNIWYIYTMEYYSAIKRDKIGSFVFRHGWT